MENAVIEKVCVNGNNLPQTIALLVRAEKARENYKEAITQELEETLSAVNVTLESHQRMDRIVVFTEEWSIENELLTPTLKVKRHVIEERFKDIIVTQHKGKVVWID